MPILALGVLPRLYVVIVPVHARELRGDACSSWAHGDRTEEEEGTHLADQFQRRLAADGPVPIQCHLQNKFDGMGFTCILARPEARGDVRTSLLAPAGVLELDSAGTS